MTLTNKNSTFETWFRELEKLAKKLGGDLSAIPEAQWPMLYAAGKTPNEALVYHLDLTP